MQSAAHLSKTVPKGRGVWPFIARNVLSRLSGEEEARFVEGSSLFKDRVASLSNQVERNLQQYRDLQNEHSQLTEKHRAQGGIVADLEAERANMDKRIQSLSSSIEQHVRDAAPTTHPVYGTLVGDLGFKRIYLATASTVCSKDALPTWKEQRLLRYDRAVNIATFKKKDGRGLPGAISVYDIEHKNERGIIDGQHRVAAIDLLLKWKTWAPDTQVLLEVYPVEDHNHVKELFTEINQAEPLASIDLPDALSSDFKSSINGASAHFADSYPAMFSATSRCRKPHLNIDILRDELFESPMAASFLEDETKLISWMADCNEKLASRSDEQWQEYSTKAKMDVSRMLEKCRKHNFFLGVDKLWLTEPL